MAEPTESSTELRTQLANELADAVTALVMASNDIARRRAQLRLDNVLLAFESQPPSCQETRRAVA
jgi:hypothetical protein